ncbi:MAG: hypothetical protein WC052_05695 [Patescibacteria group bacterium]
MKKPDRREEFEKDFLYVHEGKLSYSKKDLMHFRSDDYGLNSYNDVRLAATYEGWCLAKDAELMRHNEYAASLIVKADVNPTVQTYKEIRTQTGEFIPAPEGFAWGVNFVSSQQWPEKVTVANVTYVLNENCAVEYVDVILFQVLHSATLEDKVRAQNTYKQLSDGFHIKTHFEYLDGELQHELTRLTIHHADFVELQNV